MTFSIHTLARSIATAGLIASFVVPSVALAADSLTANDLGATDIQKATKLGSGDIRQTAARIINAALGFLGIIAIVVVLLGGFKYLISGGEEKKVQDAQKLIVSGIIGLAIILSAWAITSYVISSLVTATQDSAV